MGYIFAVAIILTSPGGSSSGASVSVVIQTNTIEQCERIGKQMKSVYGQRLNNFDCFDRFPK